MMWMKFMDYIRTEYCFGYFGLRAGATMAATDRIVITIIGKGGHASTPHLCVDPVVIAAEVIMAIQTIHSRKSKPIIPVRDFSVSDFRRDDLQRHSRQGQDYRYGKNLVQGIAIPDAAFDRRNY